MEGVAHAVVVMLEGPFTDPVTVNITSGDFLATEYGHTFTSTSEQWSFEITAADDTLTTGNYNGSYTLAVTSTADAAYAALDPVTYTIPIYDVGTPQLAVVKGTLKGFHTQEGTFGVDSYVYTRFTQDPLGDQAVISLEFDPTQLDCEGTEILGFTQIPVTRNTTHIVRGLLTSAVSWDVTRFSIACGGTTPSDGVFRGNYFAPITVYPLSNAASPYDSQPNLTIQVLVTDATPGASITETNVTTIGDGLTPAVSQIYVSRIASGVVRMAVEYTSGILSVEPNLTYHDTTTCKYVPQTIRAYAKPGLTVPRTETVTVTVSDADTTATGWSGVSTNFTVYVTSAEACSDYHTSPGCPYKWTDVNGTYLCPTGCSADDCCALLPGLYSEQLSPAGEHGAPGSVSVSLRTQPTGNVQFDLSAPGSQIAAFLSAIFTSSITFTTSNWNTSQTLIAGAAFDDVAEGYHFGFGRATVNTAATADADYDALDPIDIPVGIVDDDIASIVVSPATLEVAEGSSVNVTVQLGSQPTNSVTVLARDDNGVLTAEPSEVLFTAANWNTATTIVLSASEDPGTCYTGSRAEVVTFNISFTNSTEYQTVGDTNASVTVTDADPVCYYCYNYHNETGCPSGWGAINISSLCATNCTLAECCETCDYGFYSLGGNSTCIDAKCSSLGYTTSANLASVTVAEACLTETYGCNSFRGWQYGKYQPRVVVVLVSVGMGVLLVVGFLLPAVQVLRNDWTYRDNRATFLVANVAMAALLIPAAFLMEGYSGRGHALNRHGTRAAMTSAASFQVLGAMTFAGIGGTFLLAASALWATTVWVGSTGSDTTMAGLTLFTAAQVAARNVTNRSVNEPMSKAAQSTVVLASLAAAFGFMALLGSLVLTPC